MLAVPLRPVPNQTLQIVLGGQSCVIHVYQLDYGMFCDVKVGNASFAAAGEICRNLNRIVRADYLGFVGNLVFWDTQGDTDPVYTGLGTRFFLLYLSASEMEEI